MPEPAHDFPLLGNLLCLDLVNTTPVRQGVTLDLLTSFADLVAWLEAAGNLTRAEARDALARWDGTPEGRGVWKTAVTLRGELRGMAERMVAGRAVRPETVDAVNAVLAARPAYPELVAVGRRWVRRERATGEAALHLLVPVAASAAWLLEQGDPALLRKCENPDCVLYFYDTTKNKRRRWCSMDACGARAKAAAYYRRERKKAR